MFNTFQYQIFVQIDANFTWLLNTGFKIVCKRYANCVRRFIIFRLELNRFRCCGLCGRRGFGFWCFFFLTTNREHYRRSQQ
ncbi:Uncharacterised protein [Vibrio cholerae]|nr:Uncharacterised protein [Vibrio cholerae]